jgi:membrane protein implicated in regulation of membrane protease activity
MAENVCVIVQIVPCVLSHVSLYAGYYWLICGILLLLFEVGTPGLFFFVSLAFGAFAGALAAFCGCFFYMQCFAALVGTLAGFIACTYLFSKRYHRHLRTNVEALIGQEGLVIEEIAPYRPGRVKVKGEVWAALTEDKETVEKGSLVHVVRIEGNKVVVK